jgi:putative ABC transport system permease protein
MFRNYFKSAIRNLLRSRIYSVINIAGLSLGLACAMLIVLYVKDETSYDRFHDNAPNIYHVVRRISHADGSVFASDGYTGLPQGPQFTADIPEIRGFVRIQNAYLDIKKGVDISPHFALYVDSNFFHVFTFPLLSGNPSTVLRQPNSVVISEDMARTQFGSTDVTGRTIEIKQAGTFIPYTVTGVARNSPINSSIKFNILLPIQVSQADETAPESWLSAFLNTFVVLQPGVHAATVEAKMKQVFQTRGAESRKIAVEKYRDYDTDQFLLQPLTAMHLSKEYPPIDGLTDASDPVFSYILSGIALFILLIACINFVNLSIARSIRRAKEIGVRKVIGAGRNQLRVQFLGESFVLCAAAFLLAIALVHLSLPVFNRLAGKALSLDYLFDLRLLAGYLLLFLATGLLAGVYPALVLSGYDPVQTLYGRFVQTGRNYLQRTLVVLQFALASFLIIATFTAFSQFNYLVNKPLGYDDSNLMVISHWGITPDQVALFRNRLATHPDILGVTSKDLGWENNSVKINGNPIGYVRETVDEQFIPLLKIPVVKGRNFSKAYPSDSSKSILINETFARKAGWKDPIGQQLDLSFDPATPENYTVIGVVKDYYYQPLNLLIKPQIFSIKPGRVLGNLFVKMQPHTEAANMRMIEQAYRSIFPLSSFNFGFQDQRNRDQYLMEGNWKDVMLFAAIITVFISCIGLFGLTVLATERRTKEIGIRKVLGASAQTIVTLLSKDFLQLVTLSLAVAIPVAWIASSKWLNNYPNRISLSWPLFAGAGALVVALALVTISFQAVKAALSNPVHSLRQD